MNELTRLLALLGIAGIAITLAAGFTRWWGDEGRRMRRGLKRMLKGDPHGFLVARGRGTGLGFNFSSNTMAVAWDRGAWGLVYELDELNGAEVIVDGIVVGRVHRDEPRRAVDAMGGADERVALRLVFDDLAQPDFTSTCGCRRTKAGATSSRRMRRSPRPTAGWPASRPCYAARPAAIGPRSARWSTHGQPPNRRVPRRWNDRSRPCSPAALPRTRISRPGRVRTGPMRPTRAARSRTVAPCPS